MFSIVESCRKLSVPLRQYLADTLPGLADRSVQELARITPRAYAAKIADQATHTAANPSSMALPERLRVSSAVVFDPGEPAQAIEVRAGTRSSSAFIPYLLQPLFCAVHGTRWPGSTMLNRKGPMELS
jgi:hypothetical protein